MAPPSDDSPLTASDPEELLDRGLLAVEEEDLDSAERILDKAGELLGENHPRVLHLAGLLAWARGDFPRASGFLMQAVDLRPERFEIYLDCAECLFVAGEYSDAEAQVRVALAREGLGAEEDSEAKLLLAQVRLADDDPDEAIEVLDTIDESLRTHPAWLSTRGTAMMDAGRDREAVELLSAAVAAAPHEPDYHYGLAEALSAVGEHERARSEMVEVLRLDIVADPDEEPLDAGEEATLRTLVEDVLEELPTPILELVANVPIRVARRASEDDVRGGVDPRDPIYFLGKPADPDGDRPGRLTAIGVARDLVLAEIDDEDDIPGVLLTALVEQIQVFFDRPDLVMEDV